MYRALPGRRLLRRRTMRSDQNPDEPDPLKSTEIPWTELVIKLSPEDSIQFAEAILNPPEPNEHLREAFRRYHEEFES